MQRDDKSTRYLLLKKEKVFEVDFIAAVARSIRSDFVCPQLMYQTIENVTVGGSRCYCLPENDCSIVNEAEEAAKKKKNMPGILILGAWGCGCTSLNDP
jgi:hypothetical protein